MEKITTGGAHTGYTRKFIGFEYGVCFSLIVNRERQFSIDAARKIWCPFCHKPQVDLVPAKLRIRPKRRLTKTERQKLERSLDIEIDAKLRFKGTEAVTGDQTWKNL
jgi:hypothetical protein